MRTKSTRNCPTSSSPEDNFVHAFPLFAIFPPFRTGSVLSCFLPKTKQTTHFCQCLLSRLATPLPLSHPSHLLLPFSFFCQLAHKLLSSFVFTGSRSTNSLPDCFFETYLDPFPVCFFHPRVLSLAVFSDSSESPKTLPQGPNISNFEKLTLPPRSPKLFSLNSLSISKNSRQDFTICFLPVKHLLHPQKLSQQENQNYCRLVKVVPCLPPDLPQTVHPSSVWLVPGGNKSFGVSMAELLVQCSCSASPASCLHAWCHPSA